MVGKSQKPSTKARAPKIPCLLFVGVLLLSPNVARAASLETTIATHVTPIGVLYDPKTSEIFVSNYDSGDIQVISDKNNTQVADITNLPGSPYNMAYDSSKSEIWVAGATLAYAISDATNQIVANVTTHAPQNWGTLTDVAYDPTTSKVFVSYTDFTGLGSSPMQVISDSSNTVIANITQSVSGIVDDSAKSEIFASQYSEYGGAAMYVISANTYSFIENITDSGSARSLVYDSGKGEIFASYPGATIQAISDSTNSVVATINFPPMSVVGGMAYNPNKGEIYVNNGTSVEIISDATNSLVGTVSTKGSGGSGIAYDSGTSTVYAINNAGSTAGNMGSLAVILDSGGTSTTGTTTSTALPTTGATSTVTTTTTTTMPSTSTSSSQSGGGIPEFPYALTATAALVVLVAVSYLLVRSRTFPRGSLGTGAT